MSGPLGSSQWMYSSDGYEINNSLRFESGDSAYLTRTPGADGNRRTWTMSYWIKRGNIADHKRHFGGSLASAYGVGLIVQFDGNNQELMVVDYRAGYHADYILKTNMGFRDTANWYHIVVAFDTTQGTAANRIKLYANGQQLTMVSATYPDQNTDARFNEDALTTIGAGSDNESVDGHLDGYMAEINFVDGTQLTPASFGETDDIYGHWKPKEYSGSYGNNGYYLDFASSGTGTASSSTIGADRSGNDNHWTSSGIGAADQMIDSPTNNFCVFNINHHDLERHSNNLNRAYSQGALRISTDTVAGVSSTFFGTIGVNTGKWYFEAVKVGGNVGSAIGIGNEPSGTGSGDNIFYYSNGNKYDDDGSASYGDAYSNGEVIGVAFDVDNQTIEFYNEGVSQGELTSAFVGGEHYFPQGWDGSGSLYAELIYNFGQDSSFAGTETAQGKSDSNGRGDFYYAPPAGFLALCSKNLPHPAVKNPEEHFKTVLYTGTGSSNAITGVGFQPEMTMISERDESEAVAIVDILRGNTVEVNISAAGAQSDDAQKITAIGSDGFTVGTSAAANQNGNAHVSYNWKFGGSGSSNTTGGINSTVTVNPTAGMSIVKYEGTGSASTVGHGLSTAPQMMWIKNLDSSANWSFYHVNLGNTHHITQTDGIKVDAADRFNDTTPTATVFSVGDSDETNKSGDDHIAYCFEEVEGFSSIGAFTGNGKATGTTGGTFVYTGFRPAWVWIKNPASNSRENVIFDNKRNGYNVTTEGMSLRGYAETVDYGTLDLYSNGFKMRSTSVHSNENGVQMVYIAFAEKPFKFANGS